jgi:hypothetical protein
MTKAFQRRSPLPDGFSTKIGRYQASDPAGATFRAPYPLLF